MNTLRILLLCLGALTLTNAHAASVAKLSLENFIDAGKPYWEVNVTCTNSPLIRAMVRPIESETWCSADSSEYCDKNKYSLSRKLCNDNFTTSIASEQTSKTQSEVSNTTSSVVTDSSKASKNTMSKPIKRAPIKLENAATLPEDNKTNVKKDVANKTQTAKVAAVEKTSASREELLLEQVQIEEQRILVGQKKLELRRKELAIQKRQLNDNSTN